MLSQATAVSPVPWKEKKSSFPSRVFAVWSLQDVMWIAYLSTQVITRVRPDELPVWKLI